MLKGFVSAKVPIETRIAIEEYAKQECLSLGAATRYFLRIGIEKEKAVMA